MCPCLTTSWARLPSALRNLRANRYRLQPLTHHSTQMPLSTPPRPKHNAGRDAPASYTCFSITLHSTTRKAAQGPPSPQNSNRSYTGPTPEHTARVHTCAQVQVCVHPSLSPGQADIRRQRCAGRAGACHRLRLMTGEWHLKLHQFNGRARQRRCRCRDRDTDSVSQRL